MSTIIRLHADAVFNENAWNELQLILVVVNLPLAAMRVPDADAPTLKYVAEVYYRTQRNSIADKVQGPFRRLTQSGKPRKAGGASYVRADKEGTRLGHKYSSSSSSC